MHAPTFYPLAILAHLAGAMLLQGCTTASSDVPLGSESHFLSFCDDDADCPDLSCIAGRCSKNCEVDADCSELGASTCEPIGTTSSSSCDIACSRPSECTSLDEGSCADGWCRQGEPSLADDDSTLDPSDAGPGQDGAAAADDAGVADNAADAAEDAPADDAAVDDAADASPPAAAGDDAAAPKGDAAAEPAPDEMTACSVSADCGLASLVTGCCSTCPGAYALDYILSEPCLGGEPETGDALAPDSCRPVCEGECGVSGACYNSPTAVCYAGRCVVADLQCGDDCAAGEICVNTAMGDLEDWRCVAEECDFDSCHPERCDEVGEACCDPLPGDGPNYCGAGLVCGPNGCEASAASGPPCGDVVCGSDERCCDKCLGSCVNALSGANCPDDNDPGRVCTEPEGLPCGEQLCLAGEYCLEYVAASGDGSAPATTSRSCEVIPSACEVDEVTCECAGADCSFGCQTAGPLTLTCVPGAPGDGS